MCWVCCLFIRDLEVHMKRRRQTNCGGRGKKARGPVARDDEMADVDTARSETPPRPFARDLHCFLMKLPWLHVHWQCRMRHLLH